MKNKKKIIIICISLVIVVLIILGSYFIFFKDDKVLESNKRIVSKSEYIGYSYNGNNLGELNYYINNGNNYVGFNKRTSDKVFEFKTSQKEFNKLVGYNKDIVKYYVVKENNEYKLYDLDGNLIKKSNREIKIKNDLDKKVYYLYDGSLYDEEHNLIYNDILKAVNNIKEENFDFSIFSSYILCKNINENEFVYILDLDDNSLIEYRKNIVKQFATIIYNDEKDKMVISNNGIWKYGEKIEFNGYKFDYMVCEDGFKVYTSDDKLLIDDCYGGFQTSYDGITYVYKIDGNDKKYLKDNKVYNKIPVGEYYINGYTNVVVYDSKEKEISKSCSKGFSYYRNNLYLCKTEKDVYLVNSKLKKVSDIYDDLDCSDTYCSYKKDGKYGLLYENKNVIEPVYNSIDIINNSIVAVKEYGLDLFTLGDKDFLRDDELYEEFTKFNDIDVDKVIEEYKLDDIKDLIKNNEDLFKKYAFVVLNNNSFEDYKKDILNYFKIVALNKKYLDEEKLISSLKDLKIEFVDEINSGATGSYNITNNTIELLHSLNRYVLNHEFVHFINSYNVSDNEFVFIKEGGTEYYSSMYFSNNITVSYPFQVQLYNMFVYIFGDEFMKDIYFSNDGSKCLYDKLIEIGFEIDDIKKFDYIVNPFINNSDINDRMYVVDMMVDIYEKEKDCKWYDDKIFVTFIKSIMPEQIKASDTKRYDEYIKIKNINNDIQKRIVSQIDDNYDNLYGIYFSIYYEDNFYYRINAYKKDGYKRKQGYLVVNYDIINEKVKDYSFVLAE